MHVLPDADNSEYADGRGLTLLRSFLSALVCARQRSLCPVITRFLIHPLLYRQKNRNNKQI